MLLFLLCFCMWGCSVHFATEDSGAGGGGAASGGSMISGGGTALGGEHDCCTTGGIDIVSGGGQQSSGGTKSGASGGETVQGPCGDEEIFCVEGWAGLWDEAGVSVGPRDETRFSQIGGVTSNEKNIFVSHEHAVSMIDRETLASTILAGGRVAGDVDAVGPEAHFNRPTGIIFHEGFLYVADTGNRKIKRIEISTGNVETYLASLISGPTGLEVWPPEAGRPPYLLIADEVLHVIVRVEIAEEAPIARLLAGTINQPGENSVLLDRPHGLLLMDSTLFISERGNHQIRSIDLSLPSPLNLQLHWGRGSPGFAEGEGTSARLNDPMGLARFGNALLVLDSGNHVVRSGVPGKSLTVLTGQVSVSGHQLGGPEEALFENLSAIHRPESGFVLIGESFALTRMSLE